MIINNSNQIYLIVFFIVISFVNCINIERSNVVNKRVNLLGEEYNYLFGQVEFDQELYIFDDWVSCPNINSCPNNNSIIVSNSDGKDELLDCSCDYTDKNECPKVLDSRCNKECSNDSNDYQCSADEWIVLNELDKQYIYSINKTTQFRYKANGLECSGISIKINSIDGFGYSSVGSNLNPNNQRKTSSDQFQRNVLYNLCPSFNILSNITGLVKESWTSDTYFIQVSPILDFYNFSITIHSIKINNEAVSDCTSSTNCLTINKVTQYSQDELYHLNTLQITESAYYYFNFPTIDNSVFYYISDVFQYPIQGKSTWELNNDYENSIILYLEPISSNEPLTIYITSILNLKGIFNVIPSSNVIISVSNIGKRYLTPISSLLSVQHGALSLRGTSRLLVSSDQYYSTPSFANENSLFSVLFPQIEFNTIIPAPQFIFDDYISKSVINEISQFTSFKQNSYQFSFLLGKSSSTFIKDYYQVKNNSILNILSNIFDKNGLPISLNITFKDEISLKECDKENYKLISSGMNKVSKLLHNSTNNNSQATSLIFNLNLLLMSDTWSTCQTKMNSYYNQEYLIETRYIKECPYQNISDPLYINHPCCSLSASYYECCNPVQSISNISRFTNFNLDRIKSECSSLDCTLSVLTEFNRTVSTIDECATSLFEVSKIGYSATKVLRNCKKVLVSPPCSIDSDCLKYGSKCDLYKRKCIPDFEIVDKLYIQCVLENLSIGAVYYLLNGTTQINQTSIDTLYNQNLNQDCIGSKSIMDRSTYEFISPEYSSLCFKIDGCLDKSCKLEHDNCFDNDIIAIDYIFNLDSRIVQCNTYGFCPAISECTDSQDCKSKCTDLSFCGYCSSNSTQCYNIKEFNSETLCSDSVCLLADGTYLTGLTEEECNSKGFCSKGCGYSCSTSIDDNITSGCFALVSDKETCATQGDSQWSDETKACYLPLKNKDNCISQDQIWVDCASKSAANGECYGPSSNIFICKAIPTKCSNKTQCELESGECSDQYYFSNKVSNSYTSGLGKCVHNHTFKGTPEYPVQCAMGEKDSPEGCFKTIPINFSKAECESFEGYKWWTPAQSKQECLNNYGCSTIETYSDYILPYNFKFNEMDQETCLGCKESLNQYINKYEWVSGKWLPGISIKPQWLTNKNYISNRIVQKVFNYQSFYSNVMLASDSQSLELFKTESFCKTERLLNSLDSLICSCSFSNNNNNSNESLQSSCFSKSSPVLGQTKVCSNQESEFKFDYGILKFSNQSIDQTCQIFGVSQIAKELYTATVHESLASNFVSYNKPDNFAIVNSKDAIVGTLLGDGIMISNLEGINQAKLCFKISTLLSINKDKYPVLDIAIQVENSKPTPLNIEISLFSENLTDIDYYCADISDIPSGGPIYFIINRFEDWRNTNKQLFDRETRGLMYTLSCLFLILSVIGIYEVCTIVYFHLRKIITQFQPIQLLIILTSIFVTIRCVYFFLLVNGELDNNPVLDYILVVLPTFIYFTIFTLIVTIWYCIVFLVLKNNRGQGLSIRLYRLIFIINIILYLFFIAIAIVFQYTKFKVENDCGSRIVIPNKISNQQKGISLAYAIVQAALSLIIGAAFIYLGKSLYRTISSNLKGFSNTKHQNKIQFLSIVCSSCFILHCAFVLVLVSNINSMIFSFIGLVITEIIPVLSILICFNPNSIQKEREYKETKEKEEHNKNNNKKHYSGKNISSTKLSKITSSSSNTSSNILDNNQNL